MLTAALMMTTGLVVSCGGDEEESDEESKDGTEESASSDDSESGSVLEMGREAGIESCLEALQDGLGASAEMFDADKLEAAAEEYCSCAIDKFIDEEVPIGEMMTMGEAEVMEIAGECLETFQTQMMSAMNMDIEGLEEAVEEEME